MDACCSPLGCHSSSHSKKHRCPANGQEYSEVSVRTIAHHIKTSWAWTPTASCYFFCEAPDCDIVYLGDDGSTIVTSQLRTRIGVKENNEDSQLCYCFGVCNSDFQHNPNIKDFVIKQTKAGLCSCETSNPSGRCCLKDFPRAGN